MRMESDYEMSPAWVLVPLIPIVGLIVFFALFFGTFFSLATTPIVPGQPPPAAFAFAALFGLLVILYVAGLIAQILYAYMLYKLVNRRNKHFQRQGFLYDDLTNLAKELAAKKGADVSLALNNMERANREARYEETEKSAALWAIVTFFIGITALYVYYFLMKDFYKHERREDMFLDDLNRALMVAGVTINLPRRTLPVPDRSFVLYIILSIITLGIFAIYWLYVLLTDPNSHFRQQALTEDTILAQVTPLMA
jgi:hypothetical protein